MIIINENIKEIDNDNDVENIILNIINDEKQISGFPIKSEELIDSLNNLLSELDYVHDVMIECSIDICTHRSYIENVIRNMIQQLKWFQRDNGKDTLVFMIIDR